MAGNDRVNLEDLARVMAKSLGGCRSVLSEDKLGCVVKL